MGEYNATTGAAINANFISGLNPSGLAVSGNILFVTSSNMNGTVGEYDATTGAAINANFIGGLSNPSRLAVSGNTLFVSSGVGVGDYNATTGAAINAALIPGSSFSGLAVSGNALFVTSQTCGLLSTTCIGEYDATTGAAINPKLLAFVGQAPGGLAVMGNNLFVAHNLVTNGFGMVGEFNATTGVAINANLISGLAPSSDIAISSSASTAIPEPSSMSLIGIGGLLWLGIMLRRPSGTPHDRTKDARRWVTATAGLEARATSYHGS